MPVSPPAFSQFLPEQGNEQIDQTQHVPAFRQETAVERARSEEIARLAYVLWQQRGCPAGSAETDWLEAEQQLSH